MKSMKTKTTIQYLIILIISIMLGNYTLMIAESLSIHVWVARAIGALTSGIVGVLLYQVIVKKRKSFKG